MRVNKQFFPEEKTGTLNVCYRNPMKTIIPGKCVLKYMWKICVLRTCLAEIDDSMFTIKKYACL